MKYGLSILLNEYLKPDSVEYKDTEIFQIVCPECYEPIFKVVREDEINYFSHYKKDRTMDSNCSLRVDSITHDEIEKTARESKGQNIEYFLSVFRKSVISHEVSGNTEKILLLIEEINNSNGFSEIKNKIAERFRELSTDDQLILSFFDDYLKETDMDTKFSFLKQKEYALILLKHLCSPKAKENLGFLICYAGIFLTTRLEASFKLGEVTKWQVDMYNYLSRLLKCKTNEEFQKILVELLKYKLNPPWVQKENTSMLVKIISEIAYESCGVIIRFPFFKVLKQNIRTRK